MQQEGYFRNELPSSSGKQPSDPGNPVLSPGLRKGIALARESEEGTARELVVGKERAICS